MSFSPLIDNLVKSLQCLPGVGPRSAQRMALHLLERDRKGAARLSSALDAAVDRVAHCSLCRNFTEEETCATCRSKVRDGGLLCVVETPADLFAIEQAGIFRGLYFVLMGHLSPIDGIGPEHIGMDLLKARLQSGEVREVILATGTTVEGEATAHYIFEMASGLGLAATRIAHGVPVGGELEYVDSSTLGLALAGRRAIE